MRICSACGHALTPDGPCGFASFTVEEKTAYFCHGDDHSCYMGAAADTGKVTSAVKPPSWTAGRTGKTPTVITEDDYSGPLPDAAEETGETDSHDDAELAAPSSDAVRDLAAPSNGSVGSRPSPGADPRIPIVIDADFNFVDIEGEFRDIEQERWARVVIAAADAADRAAGIVRIDTRDEATVERITATLIASGKPALAGTKYSRKFAAPALARAVLAALAGEQ